MNMKRLASLAATLVIASGWQHPLMAEDSAADLLMKSVGGTPVDKKTERPATSQVFRLDTPFTQQLFAEWQLTKDLSFEMNQWVQMILQGKLTEASHLFSTVSRNVPGNFEPAMNAAQLYCLWNLKTYQTFFSQWVNQLGKKSFKESKIAFALEQTIGQAVPQILVDEAIAFTPEERETLKSLDAQKNPVHASLIGWANLRNGTAAESLLPLLTPDHPFKGWLAETAALSRAKKQDLSAAARILKEHLEPTLEAKRDASQLARHYLQIARLLYQAGSLDGAESFYLKVPNGSSDYLTAREELSWVWLRKGDLSRLRGEVTSLSSGVLDDKFVPEVYLVRAISNLKLCFYDRVEKDINQFVKLYGEWAKKIDQQLKASDPQSPALNGVTPDRYLANAEKAVGLREKENEALGQLAQASITASVPAVGPQSHWKKAQEKMMLAIEDAKKTRAHEYRRVWKSRELTLKEAIRKMQFVKVEWLSQVRAFTQDKANLSAKNPYGALQAKELKEEADLSFPFDGVMWPDELFKLRSVAQARCLGASE